jgi:hypothetical protein
MLGPSIFFTPAAGSSWSLKGMIWPPELAANTSFHPSGPGPGEHTKQQWLPSVHLSGTTLRSTELRIFNPLEP